MPLLSTAAGRPCLLARPGSSAPGAWRSQTGVARTPAPSAGEQARPVKLLGVHRAGMRVPGKLLDARLRENDVLTLKGTPEAMEQAIALLAEGGVGILPPSRTLGHARDGVLGAPERSGNAKRRVACAGTFRP